MTSILEIRGPGEPLDGSRRRGLGPLARRPARPAAQPRGPRDARSTCWPRARSSPPRAASACRCYDKLGVVSAMHVLIGDRAAPWGVLSAASTEHRDFDEADRDFLQAVGHVIGDAVARQRAEEAARYDALHDPLTGLPNRALLVDRLAQALRRAQPAAHRCARARPRRVQGRQRVARPRGRRRAAGRDRPAPERRGAPRRHDRPLRRRHVRRRRPRTSPTRPTPSAWPSA